MTPTFQTVLNTEILKIMDALDSRDYDRAYGCLKTLISVLNPLHSKEFIKNDLAHIDSQLAKAQQQKSVDTYQMLRIQHSARQRILREHVRPLFCKVMAKLHEKGYLEKKALQPHAKGSGRLKTGE